jgi:hypothetical protein
MDRAQITRNVRKALKDAGFTGIKVSHGTGTAWGWLDVTVDRSNVGNCRTQHDTVEAIAADAAGRKTAHMRRAISVTLTRVGG